MPEIPLRAASLKNAQMLKECARKAGDKGFITTLHFVKFSNSFMLMANHTYYLPIVSFPYNLPFYSSSFRVGHSTLPVSPGAADAEGVAPIPAGPGEEVLQVHLAQDHPAEVHVQAGAGPAQRGGARTFREEPIYSAWALMGAIWETNGARISPPD